MDRERYREESEKNVEKYHEAPRKLDKETPEAWPQEKELLETFIEDQDELHKVYTEEQKKA